MINRPGSLRPAVGVCSMAALDHRRRRLSLPEWMRYAFRSPRRHRYAHLLRHGRSQPVVHTRLCRRRALGSIMASSRAHGPSAWWRRSGPWLRFGAGERKRRAGHERRVVSSRDEPFERRSRALRAPDRAARRGRPRSEQAQGRARLVVGAGGLGSPALQYLAGAGVGTLGILDDDEVALSNLHRQIIHGTDDVGRPKTESAAAAIKRINPHVEVEPLAVRLDAANAGSIVERFDVVLDGSDNFATGTPSPTPASMRAVRWSRPRSANSTAR